MKLLSQIAIVTALVISGGGFLQLAKSQTKPVKNNTGASVSGKVRIEGKPAPGVVVGIRSNKSVPYNPTLKSTTDQEGNYRISDIPAGSYVFAPMAPAFVISDVNNPMGQSVVVAEGESVGGIDFDLTRGGVITGRVTDADGHPIVEERVSLLPLDQVNQRGPAYDLSAGFQTNDQGVYRVFGIRPGRYKVSVGVENDNSYIVAGKPAFRRTFHSSDTDPAKAAVVEVGEGTEVTNVDITLSPMVSGFSVTGRVVDERGKAVSNLSIGLARTTAIGANQTSSFEGPTGIISDNQGEFRLQNLPPGKYSIRIYPPAESDLRAEPNTFEINDQDVTGLLIKCFSAAGLSGVVVLEGSNSNGAVTKFSQLFIGAVIQGDNTNSGYSRSSWIKSDGSFRIGGFPSGIVKFWLGGDALGGLAISRIERDGVVQPNGIEIKNGEHVTGIRVLVVRNNGAIRGMVKVENGTWPSGARLFIQLFRQGNSRENVNSSEPDSRGHFLIEGLPAGSYELRVTAFVPESRHRPIVTTQIVTVAEGLPTDVTATIDLSSTSNP